MIATALTTLGFLALITSPFTSAPSASPVAPPSVMYVVLSNPPEECQCNNVPIQPGTAADPVDATGTNPGQLQKLSHIVGVFSETLVIRFENVSYSTKKGQCYDSSHEGCELENIAPCSATIEADLVWHSDGACVGYWGAVNGVHDPNTQPYVTEAKPTKHMTGTSTSPCEVDGGDNLGSEVYLGADGVFCQSLAATINPTAPFPAFPPSIYVYFSFRCHSCWYSSNETGN